MNILFLAQVAIFSVVQNHLAILVESIITLGRPQSKTLILSTNVDKNR